MFRSPKDFQITNERKRTIRKPIINEYTCDFCENGPWPTERDVESHMKNTHNWVILKSLQNQGSGMCSICLRMQKDVPSLIHHIKQVHYCCEPDAKQINREIYICDLCDRIFFNKLLLIAHFFHWHPEKHAKAPPPPQICPKCRKLVPSKSLWFHFLYHGMLNISTCPICFENCMDRVELIEHIKTHPGHFFCYICGYESTKEIHFINHLKKHKRNVVLSGKEDVSRYFLPRNKIVRSIRHRMKNIFKGIPFTNYVSVCILCRALCETEDEMRQHILGDHAPEEKAKSKTYMCSCGKEFFNNVLLKHHIFRMKGNHRVWDGKTPIPKSETEVVYQIYEISDPDSMDVNELIITPLQNVPVSERNDPLAVGGMTSYNASAASVISVTQDNRARLFEDSAPTENSVQLFEDSAPQKVVTPFS